MKKKYIKYIIIIVSIILMSILLLLIYNNMFAKSNSTRYEGIENYKLTNDEKNAVKDKINELEGIKSIDVYTDSKIIKIVVKLKEDINFDDIKRVANESIEKISEENLSYYDIGFFVESNNKESKVYPQIGSKFKGNSEFAW